MDRTTVHMSAKKQISLQEVHDIVHQFLKTEGAEHKSKTIQKINGVEIWTLVYEMFFFRSRNYASLTIVLTEYDDEQTACIVGSGAGGGVLNVSHGAGRKFTELCEKSLQECGFDFTYFKV